MTALLAGLAGTLVMAGLSAAAIGARRTTAPPRPPLALRRRARPTASSARSGWERWRWPVALGTGALAWAVTGWPVIGAILAATVAGLPVLLCTSQVAARRIARVEAIEEWTRRLADILVAGV